MLLVVILITDLKSVLFSVTTLFLCSANLYDNGKLKIANALKSRGIQNKMWMRREAIPTPDPPQMRGPINLHSKGIEEETLACTSSKSLWEVLGLCKAWNFQGAISRKGVSSSDCCM